MIEKLYIKNYLIIKEAEISFNKGINILTGETGAGKSIILDALALILGERADYSKIKTDGDKLIVEGHFNFENNKIIKETIKSLLPEDENNNGNVILRRELLKKGISRNFINDNPVNIAEMKNFGNAIIDIHSQNEHQSLLNKETHIEILDNYSNNSEAIKQYDTSFRELKYLVKNFTELINKKDELISKRSFLEFELKELNNLNLIKDEDDELEKELRKLENIEDISIAIGNALRLLYEDDNNSAGFINSAIKDLKKAVEYFEELEKIIKDLESSYILVKESSDSLSSYNDKLNYDNERTEQIRNRLSNINHLKKKYSLSLDELILKSESLQKELLFAENFDFEIQKLSKEIDNKKEIVISKGKKIFELRKKKSKELEKNINKILKEVGLESAEFKVSINNLSGNENDIFSYKSENDKIRLGNNGYNEVEFLIKTNKGFDFTPLQKSASGGEISRIMLAIKTVLSEKDNIGILVFDEIDAGISGSMTACRRQRKRQSARRQ
jgi:DNA repair protein RecN (Recombination protein N)